MNLLIMALDLMLLLIMVNNSNSERKKTKDMQLIHAYTTVGEFVC